MASANSLRSKSLHQPAPGSASSWPHDSTGGSVQAVDDLDTAPLRGVGEAWRLVGAGRADCVCCAGAEGGHVEKSAMRRPWSWATSMPSAPQAALNRRVIH